MSKWFKESTYLILLSTHDESHLLAIQEQLHKLDQTISVWHEPDMGDQLTAIAVAPNSIAARMLSSLPLTLKEPAMT
jgi:hypothetical protein